MRRALAFALLLLLPAACFTVKLEREVVIKTEREITIKTVAAASAPASATKERKK